MRIPKNKILENQYTAGGEFIEKGSKTPYTGYYFVVDTNKYFVGKTYNYKAVELVRPTTPTTFQSLTYQYSDKEVVRYFYRKINVTPITIKEISFEVYEGLKDNPLYKIVQIRFANSKFNEDDIKKAEKDIKDIRLWLDFSF